MKVLITGINGFIGRHLAAELLKKNYDVVGLGRDKNCKLKSIIQYYSGSVLDKHVVQKAMKGVDAVIHLAALTAHNDIIDNKFETLELNFLGTKHVLDAFHQSKTAKMFLYTSTGKVYGKIGHLPISEKDQAQPLNILGKSKLITERLIDFYASDTLNKSFIIFRIFNVYGPGQKENFLIPTILEQINKFPQPPLIKGESVGRGICEITLGDIKATRDYVYIDDVINAFLLALEKKEKTGIATYNICTGIGTSAAQIVSLVGKVLNKKIVIKTKKSLLRSDEMSNEYGSFSFIEKKLGWKPKVTLAEGLTKLLQ